MSGKVYFISGTNRGIGFEFAKLLSENPANTVIATARDPSKAVELQKLADSQKNVKIVKLDVSDKKSVDGLDSQLKDIAKDGIDVLISNAAIGKSYKKALATDEDVYLSHYKTNVLGAILLTSALLKYLKLKETRRLVYISSVAGSITGFVPFTSSAYGQTKAALNYTVKELDFELGADNFTVVALHPGVVSTDMNKEVIAKAIEENPSILETLKDFKSLTPAESAKLQFENVINKLTRESSGKFFNENGDEIPF